MVYIVASLANAWAKAKAVARFLTNATTHPPIYVEETISDPPRLPPELERYIFEQAARSNRNTAYQLLFVAKRVRIWIEPFLQEKVILRSTKQCRRFLRTFKDVSWPRKPSRYSANDVRSLCIGSGVKFRVALRVLLLCKRVENLAFWLPPSKGQLMESRAVQYIQPKRLSCRSEHIQYCPDSHPFFAEVTHLHLLDWQSMHMLYDPSRLAKLEFFSFNFGRCMPWRDDACFNSAQLVRCVVRSQTDFTSADARLSDWRSYSNIVISVDLSNELERWERSLEYD